MVCIDCQPKDGDYTRTVDFCDDPRCLDTAMDSYAPETGRGPHLPSHDFFKVKSVVHLRDMHAMNRDVMDALQSAQRAFSYDGILDTEETASHVGQSRQCLVLLSI